MACAGTAKLVQWRAIGWTTRPVLGPQPASYPMGAGSYFPEDKAAGVWNWPLTSILLPRSRMVELYLHSSIDLHGVVFNKLSTGATLSLLFIACLTTLSVAQAA
jgi:hypothetical protein